MAGYTKAQRSTSVRAQHRRRYPPHHCAACGAMGAKLEQDHIIGLSTPGTPGDVITNYQWLCAKPPHGNGCHEKKTQREIAAGKARAQAKRGSLSRKYRDLETHPGRIPPQ